MWCSTRAERRASDAGDGRAAPHRSMPVLPLSARVVHARGPRWPPMPAGAVGARVWRMPSRLASPGAPWAGGRPTDRATISRRTRRATPGRRPSRLANARHGGRECDSADPQTGVASGVTQSRNVRSRYRCSMCPAIHINSRSWLRPSSTHEPSDPPHRVVIFVRFARSVHRNSGRATHERGRPGGRPPLSVSDTQSSERENGSGGGGGRALRAGRTNAL